jgi:hypothetical protein
MSKYEVRLSEDGMLATIKLVDDGKPPTIGGIQSILKEKNVAVGIKAETIEEIISDPNYDKEYVIATGIPPKTGKDGKIIFQKFMEKDTNSENNYMDLKERSELIIVKRGFELARIEPPTKGEPGKTVTGEVIEGLEGKEAKIKTGENTLIVDNTIISKIDGKFITKKDSNGEIIIDVTDEHKIEGNIDYSTGNVRFPGKLIINGDVKPGFVVEATLYLEIKGIVESATTICEGDAKIFGIKGSGKSLVKSKNLTCNYVENATIEVAEGLVVKTSIVNSNIKAGKHVIVEGNKGRISGGSILATNLIEADILGSEMGVKTICEVGILPDLNEKLIQLEHKIAVDSENLRKTSTIIKGLKNIQDKNKLNSKQIEYFKKSLKTFKILTSELKNNKESLEKLKKLIEASQSSAFIISRNIVYPGTEIIIHKRKFAPTKPITKVVFKLENNEIVPHNYQSNVDVKN